jgi:dipeptidase E
MVQETDALLAGGCDALYLCHWMRESGLADLLPYAHGEKPLKLVP